MEDTPMEPINREFQIAQTGSSLSGFQMEVMGQLHGGRPHVRRTSQWYERAPRRATTTRPMHRLALKSALAMLPLVISLYAMM
jgi:hypothetical protein